MWGSNGGGGESVPRLRLGGRIVADHTLSYGAWIDIISAPSAQRAVLVPYETVLIDPSSAIKDIADRFAWKMTGAPINTDRLTVKVSENADFDMKAKFYLNARPYCAPPFDTAVAYDVAREEILSHNTSTSLGYCIPPFPNKNAFQEHQAC